MFDDPDQILEAHHHSRRKCADASELLETFDACFKPARAYVPYQSVRSIYSPEEGLIKGTIFPELYAPYRPCQKSR